MLTNALIATETASIQLCTSLKDKLQLPALDQWF